MKKTKNTLACVLAVALTGMLACQQLALADPIIIDQNEDNSALPTIIVAGSAQQTKLEKIPGSVSLIERDKLQQDNPAYLQDEIIKIPNLNFAGGSNRPRFFQIRGVGDLEQYEGAPNSSVAVIVDDVDLTGVGAALTLFDIDQLEVHRGPQAVRFGSSALAGAIYLKSVNPSKRPEGVALVSLGNDGLGSAGIASNFSLTPKLDLRVSGFAYQQDGFRDNDFLGVDDTAERQEYSFSTKLNYQFTPDTSLLINVKNTQLDNGYDHFNIRNDFTNQTDQPGQDNELLQLVSAKLQHRLGKDQTLTSITSYYRTEQEYSFDGDWGNNPFWGEFAPYDFFSDQDRDRNVFAQEVRYRKKFASKQDVLLGAFYQNFQENSVTSEFSDGAVFDFLDSDYEAETIAGFFNFIQPLNSRLNLNFGYRMENRSTEYQDSRDFDFSPNENLHGGQLSLQFQANEEQIWYALVSRGFRGGGFNTSPGLPADRLRFGDESLINYEIGNKLIMLGGDLRTNTSVFYNRRYDQQLKFGVQIDPSDPLSFTFLSDDAADGESYGVEVSADYLLGNKLALNASGSLLNTEIINVKDASLGGISGRQQSHAPSWQYSLGADYFISDDLVFNLTNSARDAFYFDDSNNAKSSAYQLVSSSLTYYYNDFEFRFWGRNLLDKKYAVRGFEFGLEPPDFPVREYTQLGDPRFFGVTTTYRF